MKKIKLSQEQFAIVDDDDFWRINAVKWYAQWNQYTKSYYAIRNSHPGSDGKRRKVYMHREVANSNCSKQVDHINHDTLDNRRGNLRVCSVMQNQANRRMQITNTSGYKGVTWVNGIGKWRAEVRINGKKKYLGYYTTAYDAALAYDSFAVVKCGDFALTNRKLGLLS